MTDIDEQKLRLDQIAASHFLTHECGVPIAPSTLQERRCIGGGPRFTRVMNRVLYTPADLRSWAAKQIGPSVNSTSELTANAA